MKFPVFVDAERGLVDARPDHGNTIYLVDSEPYDVDHSDARLIVF